MITWDYRVFKEEEGDYIIREVFYDEGQLIGCTEKEVEPMGNSLAELAEQIEAFRQALSLPVLTLRDIPLRPVKKKHSPTISHQQVMVELGLAEHVNLAEVDNYHPELVAA